MCKTVGNKDVDPFIPVLIDSIAKPSEVPECVHKLSATTFVQVSPFSLLTRLCASCVRIITLGLHLGDMHLHVDVSGYVLVSIAAPFAQWEALGPRLARLLL